MKIEECLKKRDELDKMIESGAAPEAVNAVSLVFFRQVLEDIAYKKTIDPAELAAAAIDA